MDRAAFGATLRHLRTARGLGRRELAALVGCSRSYIGMLETGTVRRPDFDIVRRMAEVLEADESALLELAGYQVDDSQEPAVDRELQEILSQLRLELESAPSAHRMAALEVARVTLRAMRQRELVPA